MDFYLLLVPITSFIIFFLIHIVIFRKIDENEVIRWLFNAYFIGELINISIGYLTFSAYTLLLVFLSSTIYTLMVWIYFLGVFGVMASSVRINILFIIYKSKSSGISESEILRKYNRKIIIRKRLNRFISSGELAVIDGYYKTNRRFSFFILYNLITSFLRKLYRG